MNRWTGWTINVFFWEREAGKKDTNHVGCFPLFFFVCVSVYSLFLKLFHVMSESLRMETYTEMMGVAMERRK